MTAEIKQDVEMIQLVPPRPRREPEPVRLGPPVIEKSSPLASVCDALGTYVGDRKYGRAIIDALFSPNSSVENIYCAGVAGEGKSTFLNYLAQGLEIEGQNRGVEIEIVRVDFADAAQVVKNITGKYDSTQWTSREWERAGKVFTGMYNRAKRKVDQDRKIAEEEGKQQDKNKKVFFLVESGMTDDALEWGEVNVNRGGSLLRQLVALDSEKPENERKTLPIAFVSGGMVIPERAAEVRNVIPELMSQFSHGDMVTQLVAYGFVVGRRTSLEEAFTILSTGAPGPAIRRMHEELSDMAFFRQVTDPVYAYLLNRVSPPPFFDFSRDSIENQTKIREWAALYATIFAEMGVLGIFHGLATVLYNVPQPVVEV